MRNRLTNNEFITRAKEVHGEGYVYSSTTYTTGRNYVSIICPKHGVFFQKPYDHLKGCGCKKCVKLNPKTNDEFIEESKKIFNNIFIYDKSNYVGSQIKLIITCKKHGDFQVTPNNHLSKKQGCPVCKESKGEQKISQFLNKIGIDFIREKTFENCVRKKRSLPFDFYLPDRNLVIEYDGRHHFESIDVFGGIGAFIEISENDKFKNEFLNTSNIELLRISYREFDEIDNILRKKVS